MEHIKRTNEQDSRGEEHLGTPRTTGRLVGLVVAGALVGYGLLPFFSGGFVLVGAGIALGAASSIGVPLGMIARGLLLGLVAGLAGTYVFARSVGLAQ